MGPQKNILEFDLFKAWNEGEDNTKKIFYETDHVDTFSLNNPGIYVGFVTTHNLIKELVKMGTHRASSQLEMLKNGFLGATLNMGCNIFWFSDVLYKKPELRFLKDNYTIMEIKMYDPVEAKVPEPA